MDKKISPKWDDSEIFSCSIETAQNCQGHVEYIIKVSQGATGDRNWFIIKRYNDFLSLNNALQISGMDLPLPPKKVFGNLERQFIAERQLGLQNYLQVVLSHLMLSRCFHVKKFLDPDNFSINFQEVALQHVSMFFRSEPLWEIVEPMPDIGWRIHKEYFLVNNTSDHKQKFCLSWSEFGPEKSLSEKDLQSALKALLYLKHPFIVPTAFASCSDVGGISIHLLNPLGSLRDHICKAKFRLPFLRKYVSPKEFSVLQMNEIKTYGRQILEALKFLHDKGFPYGHLHSGNVMLENGVCKILELENSLFGLPFYFRPFIVQLKKVQTLETVDIYAFGHIIYEMNFGKPLMTPVCDSYEPSCSPQIKSVLESILTTEACKGGLPSASDLLTHPLFRDETLSNGEKPVLKLNTPLKDALKQAKEKIEICFRDEQKTLRQLKRISKTQAIISSEDEKQKRRQLNKKKLQVTNGSKEDLRPISPNSNASTSSAPSTPPPVPPPLPSANNKYNGYKSTSENRAENQGLSKVGDSVDRSALWGSIHSFDKSSLKKAITNDHTIPVIPKY